MADLMTCGHVQCRELSDIIGVELGGTLKNPAAIAAGMISVLPECGDNLAGALMAEALKEMTRLARVFRANPETLLDISGLGDLVATALSEHSRNRRFGRDIARQLLSTGTRLKLSDRILLRFKPSYVIERMGKGLHYLAEGAYAIEPLIELAAHHNVPIPVYRSLYEVLLHKKNPSLLIETIKDPQKFEELYSNTKIHVSDRKKGLERVRGAGFRAKIEERIAGHIPDDERDANEILNRIRELHCEGKASPRERSIVDKADPSRPAAAILKLSSHYLDEIIDNYSTFFRWVFVQTEKSHVAAGTVPWGRTKIRVEGDTRAASEAHKRADLIYIPRYNHARDFAPCLLAIAKKGLPFPRFYVPADALGGQKERFLVKKAGGFIVDETKQSNPLYRQTIHHYMATLLEHGVPLMLPPLAEQRQSHGMTSQEFTSLMTDVLFSHTVEIVLVPMEINGLPPAPEFAGGDSSSANPEILVRFNEPMALSDYTGTPEPEKTLRALVESIW